MVKRYLFIYFLFVNYSFQAYSQPGISCNQPVSISLPFDLKDVNSCKFKNNYQGNNGCLPPNQLDPYAGKDVFFTFTPNEPGYLTLQLYDVIGDGIVRPRMYLFKGCPNSDGVCLTSLVGNTLPGGVSVLLPIKEGVKYFVVVDQAMSPGGTPDCFSFSLKSIFQPTPAQPACTNMGFDDGDFTGWTGTLGRSVSGPPGAPTPNYVVASVNTLTNRQTITSGGTDLCGGFPQVDPTSGPYSLRLGNPITGAQGEQIFQPFKVTKNNSSFTYRYAVVFQDPGHASNAQPFFRALLRDQNGDIIPCSDFIVSAAKNLPGFFNSTTCPGVRYKPWSTVNVDLSLYAGQVVTPEFTTGDCAYGGHSGYAYIDAFCTPSMLNALGDTICIGESVTMSAPDGYSSYEWNPGKIKSQSITVKPDSSTIYSLKLTAFNGCESTFKIPIIVTTYPKVSFTYEPDNCDFPVKFAATGTVNVGSLKSRWYFGDKAKPQTSTLDNPSAMFPGAGTYPVKLIQTTDGGCVDSVIQDVIVPTCFFQVRVEGDTICKDACYTLKARAYHGKLPYQFSWSNGGVDSLIQVCPDSTTRYSVSVTDSTGSTFSDTAIVAISPPVKFESVVRNISCYKAKDGEIDANPKGFGPFGKIVWSHDSTLQYLKTDSLGPGNYTLSLTDNFGCPGNKTFLIIEPDTIQAELSLTEPTCKTNQGAIQLKNIRGGSPPYRFSLDGGKFDSSAFFKKLPIGLYSIQIRDTNECFKDYSTKLENSSAPKFMNITVKYATCSDSNGVLFIDSIRGGQGPFNYSLDNSPLKAINNFPTEISGLKGKDYAVRITDVNFCVIDSAVSLRKPGAPESIIGQIDAPSCGWNNAKIAIYLKGGIPPVHYSINANDYVSNNIFEKIAPGKYQISIKDSNGCILKKSIEVPSSEGVSIKINKIIPIICHNDSTGKLGFKVTGGVKPFHSQWSNGLEADTLFNLKAGEYTLILEDNNGCSDSDTVVLNNPLPLEISIFGPDSKCEGFPVFVQSEVKNQQGLISYNWMNGFSSLPNIQLIPDSSFTASLIVRDSAGCRDTASKFILVRQNPQGIVKVDMPESCEPVCVNYTVNITSKDSIQEYVWTSPYTAPSYQNFLKTCYDSSGIYGVSLKLTDIHGCKSIMEADSIVYVYPLPTAAFVPSPEKTDIVNSGIRFFQQSLLADSSFWDFGDGETSQDYEPLHVYRDTGYFNICLKVKTVYNCEDSICDRVYIEPYPTFYAPNSFSPDNNGVNEVFRLYFTYVTNCLLEVYNRWGEKLYSSDNLEQGWDGKYKGDIQKSDVYVWKAYYTDIFGDSKIVYGRVTLLR